MELIRKVLENSSYSPFWAKGMGRAELFSGTCLKLFFPFNPVKTFLVSKDLVAESSTVYGDLGSCEKVLA